MMQLNLVKIRKCLNDVLAKYGVTDPKKQQELIIEIINCFANRR